MSDLHIYQLNYGIEYLGLGKVMCMVTKVKYADSKSTAHLHTWYVAETKEVPGRNIGVPPVSKNENYRTMLKM